MTVDQDYAYKDYPKLIKIKGLNGFKKSSNKIQKPKENYTKGEYITLTEMNVRSGPGVNYSQKLVKNLTKDGKKHATSKNKNDKAVYKKGTEFTALKVVKNGNSYWAKTPSGYVCLRLGKEVYCKKV